MKNDSLSITVEHRVHAAPPGPAGPSPRVIQVAAMFGLGADQSQTLAVVPPTELRLGPGRVVFVTGPSGGGKSTLLRLIAQQLEPRPAVRVIDFDGLPRPGERAVVDAVDGGALELDRALRLLSLAGLNDAFVMLRRPGELSDGQRYRFRLAQTMARVESSGGSAGTSESSAESPDVLTVVLADEFGATLDRTAAAAVARNVRRWVRQSGDVCFVAATTHDDLLEPLCPDVLIEKRLGGGIEVVERAHD